MYYGHVRVRISICRQFGKNDNFIIYGPWKLSRISKKERSRLIFSEKLLFRLGRTLLS